MAGFLGHGGSRVPPCARVVAAGLCDGSIAVVARDEGGAVTGYRVSPQGVDHTLGRVRAEADGLGRALEDVGTDAPHAAGGSEIVAAALSGFVEAAQDDMQSVADRLESAPGGMVRAVAAILDGDEEMAQTHSLGLSQADTFQPPRLGYPSGTLGAPGPTTPGGGQTFDPGRFGPSQTSLAPSEDPVPAFDPKRFGARPGSATGAGS
ncbi:DUF6507 family protein [Promicromonospora sp. NPDC023805]|uniref:DUF6507 family protein n=1 Tax=Promicromonospora sp. NPDC023805 TaxID=3154696 RepID=UPI0033F99CA5